MLHRLVRRSLLAAVVVALAAATCIPASAAPTAASPSRAEKKAGAVMARMSLPEKVGQLFGATVFGTSATTTDPTDVASNHALYGNDVDNGAALLAKFHPGGIVYFNNTDNIVDPQQVASLSNGLQQAATSAAAPIPLLISTDQEGGIVNRIGPPAAVSPGNMALGATFRPDDAFRAGRISGAELRAMGVNLVHAPVADVNVNPLNTTDGPRSFGDRPGVVSAFEAAAVAGFQLGGVAAEAKHFPGLGDTTVNTDNGVAVTNETRAQIMSTDVPPFRAAIAAGAKSIMVGHVVAPALDPSGLPASLSRPIVTGLMRDSLHFDGVVATDALRADALASIPQSQVILDAINAGDDYLLVPTDLPSAVKTVLDAVQAGTISQARIDQSVWRILLMKAELGLFDNPFTTPQQVTATVGTPEHVQTMNALTQRSITLLRNDAGVLPLAPGSGKHVLVTGWPFNGTKVMTNDLAARGLVPQRVWTGVPTPQDISDAVAAAKTNDIVVDMTFNAWSDTGQQDLVNALLATDKPVIVASLGGPYDIAYTPSAPTYLATYDFLPVSIDALTATLLGTNPTGRLPVTVKNPAGTQTLFPFGAGIGYSHS